MSVAAVCWSICTLMSGLVRNFWLLYLFRFMLGIFESAFAPCAYGIIADYFHPESRGTANSIYNLGIYFGGALSSLGVLFIGSLGWAKTYVLIGFIGIGTGVAGLLFVREPTRGKFDKKKKEEKDVDAVVISPGRKFLNSAAEIWVNPTCRWACFGASFRFFGGYAIGFFMPKYFGSIYKSQKNEYGIANAFVVSLCGLISSLSGGILSDKYE
jgi:MFS family permease